MRPLAPRSNDSLPQHYAPAYRERDGSYKDKFAPTEDVPSGMRWRFRLLGFMLVAGVVTLLIMALVPKETAHTGPPISMWNGVKAQRTTIVEDRNIHPIEQLSKAARKEFDTLKSKQSRSLHAAVQEYRRRYKIPPPPNFDKWYEFATENDVQFTDEYDNIHDALKPFWGMKPLAIRERVREALGYTGDNALIAIVIRDGKIVKNVGGPDWQRDMTADMMGSFIHLLPDVDLAFNVHDEPRVVVPHGELAQLLEIAEQKNMPAAFRKKDPFNTFSPQRPRDMGDGLKFPEYKTTRFNEYAHQATWVPSRLSCPPDSPARNMSDGVTDNSPAYSFSDLGFIYNMTAFTDICQSPSLRHSHGFFDRPNAYKLSHELIPIFSQSKVSSYQDILYPSPWYYYGKTVTDQPRKTHLPQYDEKADMAWTKKQTSLWWRGTTTGGFSRNGGWRYHHRQQFVDKASKPNLFNIMSQEQRDDEVARPWLVQETPRDKYSKLMDIHFTGAGQCDPADCDEQRKFFEIAKPVNSQDAWSYKFLLDIDGNAFSGRFYAMLKSCSNVYKMALFREWHDAWLRPWVHYMPLSLKGNEYLEAVRYVAEEKEGQAMAENMAIESKEWAGKVLRNVDLEAYFFRLLLEYARLVDDRRADIGFEM